MRKVSRGKKPSSLEKYGVKWTLDLTNQIAIKGSYALVESKYKTKYDTNSIKEALSKMYGNCCCYCESRITVTGYKRIEHLKPRIIFPEKCYEWENLHYCCEVCNCNKGDQWNVQSTIVDPSVEDPLDFLEYRDHIIFPKNDSTRGKITRDHVKLNREELADARLSILDCTLEILNLAKEQEGTQWKIKTLKLLAPILEEDLEYSTFKKYIKDTYI